MLNTGTAKLGIKESIYKVVTPNVFIFFLHTDIRIISKALHT